MRVKPLTPDEVRETLAETRDQIAMVNDTFSAGDSVVVVRSGRFRTDRAVVRSLSVGDRMTVIDVNAAMLTVQDNDGCRYKIRSDYFKHNPKGIR